MPISAPSAKDGCSMTPLAEILFASNGLGLVAMATV